MKLQIHLRPEGHKAVAKGESLWSWHFLTTPVNEYYDTSDIKPDHAYLGEMEVTLPAPADAVHVALAELKRKEDSIQAEAHRQVLEIQEERAKLLSIAYEPLPPSVAEYHNGIIDV